MFYIGESITIETTQDGHALFRCWACGHEQAAIVRGIGEGGSENHYYVDHAGALDRATRESEAEARENLGLTLSLARCPSCGLRDRDSVRQFWRATVGQLGAVAVAIGLLAVAVAVVDPGNAVLYGWLGAIAMLVVVPVLYLTTIAWKWTTVDARVGFLGPGQAPRVARPIALTEGDKIASRLMLVFGSFALAFSGWEAMLIHANPAPTELACESLSTLEARRWVRVSGCHVAIEQWFERSRDGELEAIVIPLYAHDPAAGAPVALVSVDDRRVRARIEEDEHLDAILADLSDRLERGPIEGSSRALELGERDYLDEQVPGAGEPIVIEHERTPSLVLGIMLGCAGVLLLVLGVVKLPRRRWEYDSVGPPSASASGQASWNP